MLILTNLRSIRLRRGLSPTSMCLLTGITDHRYRQLERIVGDKAEPWFDEAVRIARVLNVPGIRNLLDVFDVPPALTSFDLGMASPIDRRVYRSGRKMDLATACRVAIEFGLDDPFDLVFPPAPVLNQIWATLEASERGAAAGECPWCLADRRGGAAHLSTCLPANIMGVRAKHLEPNVSVSPSPLVAGKIAGSSMHAHGLRALRAAAGQSQAQFGLAFGMQPDYYAKVERCVQRLPKRRAEALCNVLGCTLGDIYSQPLGDEA